MSGLFISFEGVDGCGKSTQSRNLAEYLRQKGYDVLVTREPGGCPISERIRELLLDPDNHSMTPEAEALLYAAARAQHVDEVIRPALEAGRVVILDRFLDSSYAYQGSGRGLGRALVEQINGPATGGLAPDLTFFLDFPPDKAFERMNRKSPPDRLERQDAAFFQRVYDDFVRIQESDPARVHRVDVSGTKQETQNKVRRIVDEFLKGRRRP